MATKKAPELVREFLERVSGSLLEDQYRPVIAELIRGHAGVYALYKGEKLYYVGLATNLMSRVKQHLGDRHKKKWDKFSVYLTNNGEHIKPIESLLLRIVNPTGNRVKGRLSGALDRKRALHNAMTSADSNRRAGLLGGDVERNRVRKVTSKSKGPLAFAGVISKRIQLRGEYKGERFIATLRKDGFIAHGGEKFQSPTAAARHIVGRNVNGWVFWKYRVDRKGWVPLGQLRK